jgi:glycosyltransferase involved in cell wall biosynthesis
MAIDVPAPEVLSSRPAHSVTPNTIELLWLGSAATQPYLELIRTDLESLGDRLRDKIKLRLVAHAPMKFGALAVDFRPWSHEQQELALLECDIGLCPMPDTVWTRGKCPFKVLQYMAYGLPWVGSAVGENLVTSGASEGAEQARGVCAPATVGAWVRAIEALADDAPGRALMGRRGRAYVEATHDRAALVMRIESLWRGVIDRPPARSS